MKTISKSKYMIGLKCPKLLWYIYNRKDMLPALTPEEQEVMKQGRIVGEYAQKLFPDGIKIEWEINPHAVHAKSIQALSKRKPIFEAGFIYNNAYSLADILLPVEDDSWDLIEVKSSASLKKEHIIDSAFQKYVYQNNGIKIRNCYLMHLNKEYERIGNLEIEKLFKKREITEGVQEEIENIEQNLSALSKLISSSEPKIEVGEQCSHDCVLYKNCFEFLPPDNIFQLRSGRKIALNLLQQGITRLSDIPDYVELNQKQKIQLHVHKSNKPFIDKPAINEFFNELSYPLYFLDFETIAPAIPIYDHTRPYQDIPFQFSLHIQDSEGAPPSAHPFLAEGQEDPRPQILNKLKNLLGNSGSIIAYNAKYEIKCLETSINGNQEYTEWIKNIVPRFVDLLIPFKNFDYYHPKQLGSASLKQVLPALTNQSYNGLEIGDGRRASAEYLRITFDKSVSAQEQTKIRQALIKYCDLDTRGMIDILTALKAYL